MPTSTNLSEQFELLRRQRGLMVGLLLMLVIVVFWVGLGLFSSQQKFAVPKEMRDLAKPLSPIVDEKVLDKLQQKRQFSPEELTGFTIYKVVVGESDRQLKLVDISYQEKPATEAAKLPSKTLPINNTELATSSATATSAGKIATSSATPASPSATPAI